MSILSKEIIEIINRPDNIKVLATTDRFGIPHVVFKGSLRATSEGLLEWDEVLESSQTNKNAVASQWFDQTIAVNILTNDKRSFQVKGKIDRGLTTGNYFEERYNKIRERGDFDLATVWRIKPEEIIENTFLKRVEEDEEKYPLLKHLDRLV